MAKIVIIKWLDAHTTALDEIAPGDVDAELHYGYPTTSYGLLIKSDEKGVSLASDRQENPDGSIHYRCAHFTPRAMILDEKVIDIAEPKPKKRRGVPSRDSVIKSRGKSDTGCVTDAALAAKPGSRSVKSSTRPKAKIAVDPEPAEVVEAVRAAVEKISTSLA